MIFFVGACGFVLGLLLAWRVLGARAWLRQERQAAEIADRDRQISALQGRLLSLDARLLAAIAKHAAPKDQPPVAVAEAALTSAATALVGKSQPDDLTRIRGVGPKLAQLLLTQSIASFSQIAAFDAADLARLDDKLGAFKGRAVRDDWVGQAAALAKSASSFSSS